MKAEPKKTYQTPKLVTYGDVRVLTAGRSTRTPGDSPGNNKTL